MTGGHGTPRNGRVLKFKGHSLEFKKKTLVMGILNATPDSFFDGGKYRSVSEFVNAAKKMIRNGADIIDIGGESTRPGAQTVTTEEESLRVLPLVKALASETNTPISIDTTRSDVAFQAVESGASIVNDISGLSFDPLMAETVGSLKVPVVVMHIKGKPETMQNDTSYVNLMETIKMSLGNSIEKGIRAGIKKDFFIVDPGIGFGKNASQNFTIIKRLAELSDLGYPVLIGPSGKSFIGKLLDLPVEERTEGTAATVAMGIAGGADIIRVHDVRYMSRVAKVCDAIKYGVNGI